MRKKYLMFFALILGVFILTGCSVGKGKGESILGISETQKLWRIKQEFALFENSYELNKYERFDKELYKIIDNSGGSTQREAALYRCLARHIIFDIRYKNGKRKGMYKFLKKTFVDLGLAVKFKNMYDAKLVNMFLLNDLMELTRGKTSNTDLKKVYYLYRAIRNFYDAQIQKNLRKKQRKLRKGTLFVGTNINVFDMAVANYNFNIYDVFAQYLKALNYSYSIWEAFEFIKDIEEEYKNIIDNPAWKIQKAIFYFRMGMYDDVIKTLVIFRTNFFKNYYEYPKALWLLKGVYKRLAREGLTQYLDEYNNLSKFMRENRLGEFSNTDAASYYKMPSMFVKLYVEAVKAYREKRIFDVVDIIVDMFDMKEDKSMRLNHNEIPPFAKPQLVKFALLVFEKAGRVDLVDELKEMEGLKEKGGSTLLNGEEKNNKVKNSDKKSTVKEKKIK